MPLKDYTTVVPVHRSISEISAALVKAGARGIGQEYDGEGHVIALEFAFPYANATLTYRLPVAPADVARVLAGQRVAARYITREHTERVAWRIVRDWVLAQLAILETRMVTLPQVMLPYLVTGHHETLYDQWRDSITNGISAVER